MKKFLVFTLVFSFILPLTVYGDQGSFDTPVPAVDVSHDIVNGTAVFSTSDDTYIIEEPGSPALPVYTIEFILPENADAESVQVNIVNPTTQTVNNVYVSPVSPYIDDPVDSTPYWPDGVTVNEDGENIDIYDNLNDWYYDGNWIHKVFNTKWKSVKIVRVFVSAYDWHPQNKVLKKLTGGNLVLTFNTTDGTDNSVVMPFFSPATARHIYPLLESAVNGGDITIKIKKGNKITGAFKKNNILTFLDAQQNLFFREVLPLFKTLMNTMPDAGDIDAVDNSSLYIITTEHIVTDSKMMKRFISSKNFRGFNVRVVTENHTRIYNRNRTNQRDFHIERISAGGWWNDSFAAIDRAEMIRSYLTEVDFFSGERYKSIDYLLLIGNPHPGTCLSGLNNPEDAEDPPGTVVDCTGYSEDQGEIPMKWINVRARSGLTHPPNDLRYAYPTDKYYSLFKEWPTCDVGGVEVLGSPSCDINFYPGSVNWHDLTVGRIPVYSDPVTNLPQIELLDGYFQKVIRYENTRPDYIPSVFGSIATVEELRTQLFIPIDYWDKPDNTTNNHIDDTPGWGYAERIVSKLQEHRPDLPVYTMLRGDPFDHKYDASDNDTHSPEKKCIDIDVNGIYRGGTGFDPANLYREVLNCVVDPGGDASCATPGDIDECDVRLHYNDLFPGDSFPGAGIPFNAATVLNRWNVGMYGAVFWSGHGRWSQTPNIMEPAGAGLPEDLFPAHVFMGSCNNGWPEVSDNLAWNMLNNGGAITVVAATRTTGLKRTYFRGGQFVGGEDRQYINDFAYYYALKKYVFSPESSAAASFNYSHRFLYFNHQPKNYLAFNFFGDPTVGHRTWSNLSSDYDMDDDGIVDFFDNCPTDPNFEQVDSTFDGVGDDCDNCLGTYNPREYYPMSYQELFVAKANSAGHKGALLQGNGLFTHDRKYFMWQPDHDLDGGGDACDLMNAWGDFGFVYAGLNDIKGVDKDARGKYKTINRVHKNHTAEFTVSMPENSGQEENATGSWLCQGGDCDVHVHYCAIDYLAFKRDRWGQDGYCTTTEKTENSTYAADPGFTCHFGFSHGSDDFSDLSVDRWYKRASTKADLFTTTNSKAYIKYIESVGQYLDPSIDPNDDPARTGTWATATNETSFTWHWRRDWYGEKGCHIDPTQDVCQRLIDPAGYFENDTMYYTLSVSPANKTSAGNIVNEYKNSSGIGINPDYFRNSNTFSRAFRYGSSSDSNTGMMRLNFYEMVTDPTAEFDVGDIWIPGCNTCWLRIPWTWIFDRDGNPIPDEVENNLGRWAFIENESGGYDFAAQYLHFPENINMVAEISDSNMISVTTRSTNPGTEHELRFNPNVSGADWGKIGVVSNWDSNIHSTMAAVEYEDDIYFISKKGEASDLLHIFKIVAPEFQPLCSNPCNQQLPVYIIEEIENTGLNQTGIERAGLVKFENSIYVVGSDSGSNKVKVLILNNNNELVEIATPDAPAARSILNKAEYGRYMYLAGGVNYNNEGMNDLWRFDFENLVWEEIPIILEGDFKFAIPGIIDGKLIMANPVLDGNTHHPAFIIENPMGSIAEVVSSLEYPEIVVTEAPLSYEYEGYCLNESDSYLKGGLEVAGECVPFSNPWYRTFSAGTTVVNVEGKGNRLYAGTSGSVRVYDISDPEDMVLLDSFSTGSRTVHDIELDEENDVAYVATSSGIYRLDISNPDTITEISFFSTPYNYQYRIKLYDGKLYAGDDNGINIRDKDDFTRLAYVNTGSVLTFSIADGEIALYNYSFLSDDVQIRDVETLYLKAYDYASCWNIVFSSYEDNFYLSCDDEEYRFEGRPDTYIDFYPLEGDRRELRDNHVYDGWAYIPDGSSIKQSTLNDVPSICGNGVIEPGELCDGNSVSCSEVDPDYISGTAYCNSSCSGYDESNCSTDGW